MSNKPVRHVRLVSRCRVGRLGLALFLGIFVSAGISPVVADGIIFPVEPNQPHPRLIFVPSPVPSQSFTVPLSVTKHHVTVNITDAAATTHVDQAFKNHENRVIEGLYIFPLPVGASISGFAMDIEGKMTKGELLDADKARGIYEDIVRQMRDPGLLEFFGTGLFKTRIYPIEALATKQVKLDYQEALTMEGNLVRYVYPLNIEKFTQDPMKDVAITVKVNSKTPITTIYSPTHSISINKHGDHEVTVGFEADTLRPEKDFVLYYAVSKKDLSLSFLPHRPDPTEDGHFMMLLSPRIKDQEEVNPALDVSLVMDVSGSMAGPKMDQARKALQFCVNALKPGSRFHLVSFATEADAYKNDLIDVNEDTRTGALEYIKRMEPMGGTNISEALEKAIKALRQGDEKRPKYILFVTDGKPTAGLTEPQEILKDVKKNNTANIRIFTFGVGDSLHAPLLDEIAGENGGVSDYVAENEDMEVKISTLFAKLTHPVMTDVEVVFHNVPVSQVYPRRIPDVFMGTNVMVLGRFAKEGEGRVTLTGNLKGNKVSMDFETTFPKLESENGFVPRIWATRKIGFLLEQIRKSGANDELKKEIVMLAKRYGILTPYTSFLVVEDKDLPGPRLREAMVPQMMDSARSQSFEESKAKYSMDSFESEADSSLAVGASREMNELKSAAAPRPAMSARGGSAAPGQAFAPSPVVKGLEMPTTKEIDERTFYLLDGAWVDSQVQKETPDITVKAYSAAYFAMLKKFPEAGKFFAVGDRLMLRIGGKVVRIHPDQGLTEADELTF